MRILRRRTAALLGAGAAVVAALGHQPVGSSSSTAATPSELPRGEQGSRPGRSPRDGLAGLDPALRDAVRAAARDAAADGVKLRVISGRRTPEHQRRLLREAVAEYGSEAEAARWVATPETSLHVSGDAVDVGPSGAAEWLAANGARYGLCQIYGNEPWHFELRTGATGGGCPPTYPDPTHDPRLQP